MVRPKTWAVMAETLKSGAALALVLMLFSLGLSTVGGTASAQQVPPYQATWEVEGAPKDGRVGLRLTIPRLKITNNGSQTWASSGPNEFRVGYRWFYGYGAPVPKTGPGGYEEVRAVLPQDIPSHGSVIYPNFQVAVPNQPGDYILHIDLVQPQQGDTWLQSKGVKDLVLNISVKKPDSTAPTIQMNNLPLYTTSTAFQVSWSGKDEEGGSGIAGYDVQYKASSDNDWTPWLTGTTLTSAEFRGDNGKTYQFRVRGVDNSGNASAFAPNGSTFTRVDSLPPTSAVDTLPATSPSAFLVRWSSFDNVDGPNTGLFDVQYRDGDSGQWTNWLSGTPGTAALFQGQAGHTYSFRVRAMDYAGNQEDYSSNAQSKTTTSAALDTVYAPQPASDAAAPPSGPTTLYFPLATKNGDNGSGTMGFVITNPTDSPADVFIRFNNFAGAPMTKNVNNQEVPVDANEATALDRVVTQLETIPAKGSKTIWAGNLYLPIYNGWAAIVSSAPVQASAVRLASDGKVIQYAPADNAQKLYMPFVRKQDPNNSSIIAVANPNTSPVSVDITYYNEAGAPIFTEKRDLARLASTRFTLAGLRTPDPNLRFTGSAIISANGPVSATVENYLDDGTVVTYSGQGKTGQVAPQLPVYKNVDGYTTSTIIQNTGNAPAQVKVEYLNDSGQVVGSSDKQLGPFARMVAWQGTLQTDTFSGKVRVSASSGTISVVVIGAGPGLKDKAFP